MDAQRPECQDDSEQYAGQRFLLRSMQVPEKLPDLGTPDIP